MSTGENIKLYRNKLNLTQKQLAKKANISESAIKYYESNRRNAKIETLRKIADALGVPLSKLEPISIQQKISNLMKEQNISIEDMIKKTGLMEGQLPIKENDSSSITIPSKETLLKISVVLNIPFEKLIKDTAIENASICTEDEQKLLNDILSSINPMKLHELDELEKIKPSDRRKRDFVSIKTMALLLDLTENQIEDFEKSPDKYPTFNLQYHDMLHTIEYLQQDILEAIFNPDYIDLKALISLTDSQLGALLNLLVSNINSLIPQIEKLSNINIDSNSKKNK